MRYRVAALSVSIGRTLGARKQDWPRSSTRGLLHESGSWRSQRRYSASRRRSPRRSRRWCVAIRRSASELIGHVPYLRRAVPTRPRCPRAHGRAGLSDGAFTPPRRTGRADRLRRRRLRHDDPPARLPRCDRPAEALLEVERCSGSQFDPVVVGAFRACSTRSGLSWVRLTRRRSSVPLRAERAARWQLTPGRDSRRCRQPHLNSARSLRQRKVDYNHHSPPT